VPALNAAAVLFTAYGNVPLERAASLIGTLLGADVSAGWIDKASARLSAMLGKAGLDEVMLAAPAARDVLTADETPVSVMDSHKGKALPENKAEANPEDKDGKAPADAPHVLIVRSSDGLLSWLTAIASRRKAQDGNHLGYSLATWLRDYKEQVLLFTWDFRVDWTNNVTAIEAIRTALEGSPWLPPLPACRRTGPDAEVCTGLGAGSHPGRTTDRQASRRLPVSVAGLAVPAGERCSRAGWATGAQV
jgi:hypothetical protein